MAKLSGQELVDYVAANPGLDMPTMLTNAGYVAIRNGKASLKKTEFFTALSAAQGLTIGETHAPGTGHRQPSFQVKASSRGVIPLSSCYAEMIDVQPGEYVKVEQEDDCLILTKVMAAAARGCQPTIPTPHQGWCSQTCRTYPPVLGRHHAPCRH